MKAGFKIGFYQGIQGEIIPPGITEKITSERPDLFCLSEYFFVGQDEESVLLSKDRHDVNLQYLIDLASRLNCAITGGTMLARVNGQLKNRCYFIHQRKIPGYYDKIHPYKSEGKGQVKPGSEYKVIEFMNKKIGLLICADVFYESTFHNIRGLCPDIIIVPVVSPYIGGETEEEKFIRDDKLWVKAARIVNCPVLKVGSVGKIARKRIQGRSLLASPKGIEFRVSPEDEDKPLLKFLSLDI